MPSPAPVARFATKPVIHEQAIARLVPKRRRTKEAALLARSRNVVNVLRAHPGSIDQPELINELESTTNNFAQKLSAHKTRAEVSALKRKVEAEAKVARVQMREEVKRKKQMIDEQHGTSLVTAGYMQLKKLHAKVYHGVKAKVLSDDDEANDVVARLLT